MKPGRTSRALLAMPLRAWRIAMLLLVGCTPVQPAGVVAPVGLTGSTFPHAHLNEVVSRYVDERGRVDYPGLARNPASLERYYLLVTTYSPDNHPELFPSEPDRLAYWINAYNGAVLATVLAYYPIDSVADVPTPFPLSVASNRIGFFLLQEVTVGRASMSLHGLENRIIRKRFDDPRIHFALDRAALGSPGLAREAYNGAKLDQQLDRDARRFFAEPRNLTVDHAARTVTLSAILDWYSRDFTSWYARQHPGKPATLLAYAALYAPPERAADLARASSQGYSIRFAEYDWALNDQSTSAAPEVLPDKPGALDAAEPVR